MHTNLKFYYFIENFNLKELSNIKKSINIIFRNYHSNDYIDDLIKTRNYCKKKGFKLYLSNNINLAIKLRLDGVYLPSFNKKLGYKNFTSKKKFRIIGSAHNISEIKIKEKQNCEEIFLSPIFKTEKQKQYLDIIKFNLQTLATNKKIIALGGINLNNLKRINLTKSEGVASITWIKKNGLK
tara:strand:+ start:1046 stop:1591 length:546 start_codon:yes stop_codon:yes gene_type:complete